MKQYIHLLTNAGIGLPTDLWLPATAEVPPQTAHQVALGVTRTVGPRYEVSVEGYVKWMDGLVEYREGASFFNTAFDDWEQQLTSGSGRAYGLEVFLQRKTGRTTGWVGYTLAWSDRQFDDLNGGARFPYRYDRRHDVSVVLNHRLSDRIELAATWVYGTGPALTLPVGRVPGFPDDPAFHNGLLLQLRGRRLRRARRLPHAGLPPPRRRRSTSTSRRGGASGRSRSGPTTRTTGRTRSSSRSARTYDGQTTRPVFKQVSLFPVIPAISYRFKF